MIWQYFQRRSLKARVTQFTLIIFLMCFWSLALFISHMLRQDMERQLSEQQFSVVSSLAKEIKFGLDGQMNALKLIAGEIDEHLLNSPSALENHIKERPILQLLFSNGVAVIGRNGTAIVDAPRTGRAGIDFSDRDYIVTVFRDGRGSIGAVASGKVTVLPALVMAEPIRNVKGEVIGALIGGIDLSERNLLDIVTDGSYGNTGYVVLVDAKQRRIITSSDKRRVMEKLPAPGENALVDRNLRGFEGSSVMVNAQGVDVLVSTKRLAGLDWYAGVGMPTAEAFAPVRQMQQRMLLATAFLTILAGCLTWWMLRRELKPLLAASQALSAQSRSIAPMMPLPIVRQDEIGHLIGGFNHLLNTLSEREQSLKESEDRFHSFMVNLPAAAFIKNEVGAIVFANPNMEQLLGDSSWQGKSITDFFPPNITEPMIADDRRALETGLVITEDEVSDADGQRRLLQKYKFRIPRKGKPSLIGGIALDITDRKKAEADMLLAKAEAEKANNAKSRFLAAASHDLRQPLLALSLYVSLIKENATPDGADLKVKLQSCVANLSELLNDLLDVSKLDAGVVKPAPTDIDVDALLASIAAVHSTEAELKGLDLHVHYSGGAVVRTDHRLIQQILNNLVANAIRYTAQGGVLIACRRHRGKHWVEVWDTGIGFAEDQAGIIFEEFQQLGDDARNRGSGLGLSIVAKAAALLELEIRVRSRPGRGSMFAVELPPGGMVASALPEAPLTATRPLRIALVEDNAMALEAMVLALENSRHEVIWAKSGRDLIDKLGRQAPDLVISDYRLAAGETGFDVIAAVRNLFADDLPAILITGDTDPAVVRSMTDRGIALLYKPLDMEALQLAIAELVERRAG